MGQKDQACVGQLRRGTGSSKHKGGRKNGEKVQRERDRAQPAPLLAMPEIDEVHISVTFTWDLQRAEQLAREWEIVGVPVKMGGPAFNRKGGEFVPGMYVKKGMTITSRGCPNKCWFCAVPKREGGKITELPIRDGWNLLDDNLLACSDEHVERVFRMLERQERRAVFTGGWKPNCCNLGTPKDCAKLRHSACILPMTRRKILMH